MLSPVPGEFFPTIHHQKMIRFLQNNRVVRKHMPPVCFIVNGPQISIYGYDGNADIFKYPGRFRRDVLCHHFIHGA